MVYLDRIYTKSGDKGQTSLGDGSRVPKTDSRIVAYGTVDELNSLIGVVVAAGPPEPVASGLKHIQNDLFDVGADLCVPITSGPEAEGHLRVTPQQVTQLERWIDGATDQLQPLKSFVLPGGTTASAHLHLAAHRLSPRRDQGPAAGGVNSHQSAGDDLSQSPVRFALRLVGGFATTRARATSSGCRANSAPSRPKTRAPSKRCLSPLFFLPVTEAASFPASTLSVRRAACDPPAQQLVLRIPRRLSFASPGSHSAGLKAGFCMQRLVLCRKHNGRLAVAPHSLLGLALRAAFTIAGCGPPQPKTGAPTATSDAPPAQAGDTAAKSGDAATTSPAGSGEADESPPKADNPADVAAPGGRRPDAILRRLGGRRRSLRAERYGRDPAPSEGPPALRQLILAGPSYSPEGLAHLSEVVQLKRLELEATRTNDVVLAALKPLVNLELLKLFKTDVVATRVLKTWSRWCG